MVIQYVFAGLFVLLVLLMIVRRIFFNKADKEYADMYNEIMTSDKYKVKGQYDS